MWVRHLTHLVDAVFNAFFYIGFYDTLSESKERNAVWRIVG